MKKVSKTPQHWCYISGPPQIYFCMTWDFCEIFCPDALTHHTRHRLLCLILHSCKAHTLLRSYRLNSSFAFACGIRHKCTGVLCELAWEFTLESTEKLKPWFSLWITNSIAGGGKKSPKPWALWARLGQFILTHKGNGKLVSTVYQIRNHGNTAVLKLVPLLLNSGDHWTCTAYWCHGQNPPLHPAAPSQVHLPPNSYLNILYPCLRTRDAWLLSHTALVLVSEVTAHMTSSSQQPRHMYPSQLSWVIFP